MSSNFILNSPALQVYKNEATYTESWPYNRPNLCVENVPVDNKEGYTGGWVEVNNFYYLVQNRYPGQNSTKI
jgi:hypothetical protein